MPALNDSDTKQSVQKQPEAELCAELCVSKLHIEQNITSAMLKTTTTTTTALHSNSVQPLFFCLPHCAKHALDMRVQKDTFGYQAANSGLNMLFSVDVCVWGGA